MAKHATWKNSRSADQNANGPETVAGQEVSAAQKAAARRPRRRAGANPPRHARPAEARPSNAAPPGQELKKAGTRPLTAAYRAGGGNVQQLAIHTDGGVGSTEDPAVRSSARDHIGSGGMLGTGHRFCTPRPGSGDQGRDLYLYQVRISTAPCKASPTTPSRTKNADWCYAPASAQGKHIQVGENSIACPGHGRARRSENR